ncbi:MAG: hypothetical protein R8M38_02445 [Mariprofundaceae bacterium]
MQIGDKTISMPEVKMLPNADVLNSLQLFRSVDKHYTAILDINKQKRTHLGFDIDEALLTVIAIKQTPFTLKVRGFYGCPESVFLREEYQIESPISLSPGIQFDSIKSIPPLILNKVSTDIQACDIQNTPGLGTHYAISDAMTLWEIPCAIYAQSGSSVFAVALNDNPEHFIFLEFPTHQEGAYTHELINPTVQEKDALITTASMGSHHDCGTFSRYQLIAIEGEAIAAKLIEQRRKVECDGIKVTPETLPLVYTTK